MSAYSLFSNYSHFSQSHEFNIAVDELTDEHPKHAQLQGAGISLKPHQLTLLNRCIEFENRPLKLKEFSRLGGNATEHDEFKTSIGVIADRVGSGKSYVVLSLIKESIIVGKDNTIVKSCGSNNIVYSFKDNRQVVKTNLLVIPHNLCTQWDKYINTFGSIKHKMINKQRIIDDIVNESIDITSYDLVVVTSTFFNRVCRMINDKNVKMQRVIFDEVDNLNIPGCCHVNANFYWFVTASYGNLLYPRGHSRYDPSIGRHMWCATGLRNSGLVKNIFMDLFSQIPREFIKPLIIKNSDAYIENSITLPAIMSNIIRCKTPHSINILHGIVDKNIIDSLNAGDVERAISYINPNNKNTEENIVSMLIEKYNKQLTNYNLRLTMTNDYVYDTDEEKAAEIASITKKIDEINSKISMITSRIHDNDVCSICYDEIENKTITKCCQNPFCFKCIHIWLSKRAVCPLCKDRMTGTDMYVISENAGPSKIIEEEMIDENEFSEKWEKAKNFEILIKKKKGAKMLVFSNYESTFTNIIPVLQRNGVRYDFIKGNGAQINAIVNRYMGNQLDVLLVNARYYATGMNLENTSDIVMFHKFETQMEQQVIGRAHRFGRTEPLNVHYLLHANEIH